MLAVVHPPSMSCDPSRHEAISNRSVLFRYRHGIDETCPRFLYEVPRRLGRVARIVAGQYCLLCAIMSGRAAVTRSVVALLFDWWCFTPSLLVSARRPPKAKVGSSNLPGSATLLTAAVRHLRAAASVPKLPRLWRALARSGTQRN